MDGRSPSLSKIVLVVAAVLGDAQGRVLVQRRPVGTTMAGLWEFPGGKVENRETPEAALVRELHEELGISVAPGDPIPLTFASAPIAAGHLVMLLYRVPGWSGRAEALHADELRWATLDELDVLPMPPADRPLVEFLRSRPNLSA